MSLQRTDLVEPKLCYDIVGAAFEVGAELGPGYKEMYYQKALAVAFTKRRLRYREQVLVDLKFDGIAVGRQFLDFLVEDRVVVELKRGENFPAINIKQIYSYLRVTGLQLGILLNFTSKGVKYKRIVNIN